MCGLPGLPTWQPRSFTPEIPFEPYIDMKRQGIFSRALYVCRQVLGGVYLVVYNNGVSCHVGPVRVLGGSAEAEIEPICVLCVGAIDRTAA